jgi:hydrogenase maturation protease
VSDPHRPGVLVVGVGNELRGDDGAGLEVARRVRQARVAGVEVREVHGDPTVLLDCWLGRHAVVLVDTMRSGASPGTILRLDASHEGLPASGTHAPSSTHANGVAEVIELARTLGSLPARVIVYAVEGRRCDAGEGLSGEVAAIVPLLADRIVGEAWSLRSEDGSYPEFSASETASTPDGAVRSR